MPAAPFDNKTVLRRKLWIPIGAVIALSLAAWIVALAALVGKNLLSSTPADSVQSLYVIMAAVVTIVGVPVAFLAVRNLQILLARGVWTTATVESISTKGGTGPVTFSYVAKDKTYKIRRDVAGPFKDKYRKGSRVRSFTIRSARVAASSSFGRSTKE